MIDFQQKCEELKVDKKQAERMDQLLRPILRKAELADKAFNAIVEQYYFESQHRLKNIVFLKTLIEKIRKNVEVTTPELCLLFLIDYLFMIEGPYSYQINLLIISLIDGGKMFYLKRGKTKEPIAKS